MKFHGTTLSAALLALLPLLATGCIKDEEYLLHPKSAVSHDDAGFSIAEGSRVVLEVTKFKGTVFPDAATSFSFYVEIEPDLLADGRRLELPSGNLRAYLSVFGQSSETTTENCLGAIEISEARRDRVVAKLDVRSGDPDLPWRLKDTVTFVRRGRKAKSGAAQQRTKTGSMRFSSTSLEAAAVPLGTRTQGLDPFAPACVVEVRSDSGGYFVLAGAALANARTDTGRRSAPEGRPWDSCSLSPTTRSASPTPDSQHYR